MGETRPWLLIPIETKVREFHSKILLATVAAARGFDVVLGEQTALLAHLPSLPRGIYIDKSISRTKRKNFQRLTDNDNVVTAWCEEGLVYFSRQFYLDNRIDMESLGLVQKFFAWGDVQASDIHTKAPKYRDRIVVTGNPRLDLLRPEFRQIFYPAAQRLREQHGRFILINTNFGRFNHHLGKDAAIELARARGLIDTPEKDTYQRQWSEFVGTLFEKFSDFIPQLSSAFPEHNIVLRPHPSENHQTWRNNVDGIPRVSVIHEGNVIPWLMASEAIVHNSCTTALEAYLLGVPSVCYRPVTSEFYEAYLPNVVSHEALDAKTLITHLMKITEKQVSFPSQASAEARRHIASLEGEFASERVVSALLEIGIDPQRFDPNWVVRLRIKATNALAALKPAIRCLRHGPRANAYIQQKFSGITLVEVRNTVTAIQQLSGKFHEVRVEKLSAHDCLRLTSV